jgi:oligopeptidase B
VLEDAIPNVEANVVWGDDNRTLYYIEKDPVTLLSKRIKAHVLGTPVAQDRLVYEEPDESFYLSIARSRDDRFLLITSDSTVSTEVRYAPADGSAPFTVLAPRQRDFEYQADHLAGRWVIRTNWRARNFRLMQLADDAATGDRARWTVLVPHSDEVYIEDYELFDDFVAIEERSGGVLRLAHAGQGRQERVRRLGRAGLCDVPGRERAAGYALVALHLYLADHAQHHLRGERRQRRAQAAQARPGAGRLRSG